MNVRNWSGAGSVFSVSFMKRAYQYYLSQGDGQFPDPKQPAESGTATDPVFLFRFVLSMAVSATRSCAPTA